MIPGIMPEHVLGGVLCPLKAVVFAEICLCFKQKNKNRSRKSKDPQTFMHYHSLYGKLLTTI